jgi:hypothetical protein
LFSNIAKLINDIKQNPKSDDFAGMTDEHGLLDNALLSYLRPTPKSDKNPIPYMSFTKFKIGITETESSKITSSFEFMLTHKNPQIRRLARDIALYAYYSGYDTSGVNSFFDLVPYEYRRQYDDAISLGLKSYNDGVTINSSDITDMVCRNYWFDHNIVPIYTKHANDKSRAEKFGPSNLQHHASNYIITDYATSEFVKMYDSVKKQYFLYKHSFDAVIYGTNGRVRRRIPIYVLTTKYGVHSQKTHIFEFINNSEISMFEENNIKSKGLIDGLKFDLGVFVKKGELIEIPVHVMSDAEYDMYAEKYV